MTDHTAKPCPFCQRDPARVLGEDDLSVIYQDGFPVSPGHTVIIPKRHVATLFEASEAEQLALLKALNRAKAILDEAHHPDGYNIGINHGQAGGQMSTVTKLDGKSALFGQAGRCNGVFDHHQT